MQLNADTHNEISFNPSGVTWEEHIVYATRGEGANYQLGYAQRCRHDVDNLDIKEASGQAQQRTLIYSSITGKLIPPPLMIGDALEYRSWYKGDLFVVSQDYRIPKSTSNVLPHMERLAWDVGVNAQITTLNRNSIGGYFNIALTLSAFGDTTGLIRKFSSIERTHLDSRIEAGLTIPGRGGNMRIFAGYERLRDDGALPIPEANSYFLIGFRFTGKDLIY
jgi:hypothetical protein